MMIRRLGTLVLALVIGGALLVGSLLHSKVAKVHAREGTTGAAAWCECVVYIQNYFVLSGAVPDNGYAKDMGPYLTSAANGYAETDGAIGIQAGAIAVFQPSFNKLFKNKTMVDTAAGHVAWIENYSFSADGNTVTVTLRGAHQPGSGPFQDANCTNVTDWTISYPANAISVAYYMPW